MRALASCLLACFLVVAACDRGAEPEAPKPERAKLLVIGLDGLDPGLVSKWVGSGALPHLGRLVARGTMTTIDCVVGTSSPVVWTTVATGLVPDEHGVTGFTIDGDPVNASHRKRPALWNILAEQKLRVATVGWMVSWPAEPDAGIVVSDRAWWGDFDDKVAPDGIVEPRRHRPRLDPVRQVVPRFSSYPYDPNWKFLREDDPRYAINYLLEKRLLGIFRRDSMYASMAREIAETQDLDVLAVYFQGPDYVGHGFWKWFEPEPFRQAGVDVPQADVDRLGTIIPAYYSYVDSLVGMLVSRVDEDALIVVLSDHGFRAWPEARNARDLSSKARFLSGNHREKATLILSGPQVRRGASVERRITHLDVLPTLLFALDAPRARDNSGQPLVELFTEDFVAKRPDRSVASHAPEAVGESAQTKSDTKRRTSTSRSSRSCARSDTFVRHASCGCSSSSSCSRERCSGARRSRT
ncbi:MAG: alkaline phosphatase family protein [Deltaproteobacteria bacterium]|nr:alkaline phosphatase family protein [Deltaproteobacteria bacterium]